MTCRCSIKWFEDGDSVQASPDQRAADHLPPLLPPAPHLLRHHLLQTFLLRGSGDGEPYRDAGHHNALRQGGDIIILCFAQLFSIHVTCYIHIKCRLPSVMGKLPATSYVRLVDIWLIFGQLIPFVEERNHLNNIICLKPTSFIYHFLSLTYFLFYIFRLFSSQSLSFITKKITISIIMDS